MENENESTGEQSDRPGKPTIFLTNNFSWIHYLQWGGTIKVTNLVRVADFKKCVSGKRIEAFFWPDPNLISKLVLHGELQAPDPRLVKTPKEAEDLLENAFYDWLSKHLTKQTGIFVREIARPPQMIVGKPIVVCQIVIVDPPSLTIEIPDSPFDQRLKTFWFEIEATELASKPLSVKT